MLLEAFDFLGTLALSPRRNPAEINASVSLKARARRCSIAWSEHQENTKAFILDTVARLKTRRTAIVLGSGLLADVPILELTDAFDHVVLVDLQHLASVRIWVAIKRLGNIAFLTRDVSGLDDIRAAGDPATIDPLGFIDDIDDVDLVISVNLLSQLAVGARRALKGAPSSILEPMVSAVISHHVGCLNRRACATCLITDIGYDIVDRQDRVLDRVDLLRGYQFEAIEKQWTWPVAPFGEIDRNHQAVHHVIARRREPSD